ncbi:hypothetical protein PR048_032745 [Dryococelus australis]|uniref:Uncharacterized protein n=1 Tax=Dryococelus australis TaxID=614101 RepID=A0ABQ9G3U4_9NEOP|nr:hypothetical protein PR048_032745 [Dryococelus australis]
MLLPPPPYSTHSFFIPTKNSKLSSQVGQGVWTASECDSHCGGNGFDDSTGMRACHRDDRKFGELASDAAGMNRRGKASRLRPFSSGPGFSRSPAGVSLPFSSLSVHSLPIGDVHEKKKSLFYIRTWWSSGQTTLIPPRRNRGRFLAGSCPDLRKWESCRTMPLVGVFSREYPPPPRHCIPVLLHTHLASHLFALKTSILRAAQISPLHLRATDADLLGSRLYLQHDLNYRFPPPLSVSRLFDDFFKRPTSLSYDKLRRAAIKDPVYSPFAVTSNFTGALPKYYFENIPPPRLVISLNDVNLWNQFTLILVAEGLFTYRQQRVPGIPLPWPLADVPTAPSRRRLAPRRTSRWPTSARCSKYRHAVYCLLICRNHWRADSPPSVLLGSRERRRFSHKCHASMQIRSPGLTYGSEMGLPIEEGQKSAKNCCNMAPGKLQPTATIHLKLTHLWSPRVYYATDRLAINSALTAVMSKGIDIDEFQKGIIIDLSSILETTTYVNCSRTSAVKVYREWIVETAELHAPLMSEMNVDYDTP